jgi:hypothetical protein
MSCNLTGTYSGPDEVVGNVYFIPDVAVVMSDTIQVAARYTAPLSDSSFSIELPDNETGNPTGWSYKVIEDFLGGRTYHIHAPSGHHDLRDLAPVAEYQGIASYVGPQGPKGDTGPAADLTSQGVYFVTDYGADPTGATDSHDAIEAAIYAASANHGGTVYLPPGKYTLGRTLAPVGIYNVRLTGSSPRGNLGDNTAGGAVLAATGNFDVLGGHWESSIIEYLSLDAGGFGGCSFRGDISNTVIQWCEINGYVGYGMLLNDGTYFGSDTLGFLNRIQYNHISQDWGRGIQATYRFTDSWITFNNIGSRGADLVLEGGPHKVIGNHLDGGGSGGDGPDQNILLENVGDTIQIVGNLLENAKGEAIVMTRPSWESGNRRLSVTISANIIRDGGSAAACPAMRFVGNNTAAPDARLSGLSISGNTIYNDNDAWTYVVELDHIDNAALTGNDWINAHTETSPLHSLSSTQEVVGNGGDNAVVTS